MKGVPFMEILKIDKSFKRNGIEVKSIMTIKIGDYSIFIFPGSLSEQDILVKYNFMEGRLRTPKHIHWVTDLLMKLQANKILTRKFISCLKLDWNNVTPLYNRDYDSIKNAIESNSIDLKEYVPINCYGEYSVEFLYVLVKLLAIQEKSNRNDAYMFGQIIEALLKDKLDIFSIISKAGYNGR